MLPDRNPAFARFVAPAQATPGGLLLLGAVLFLLLVYVPGSLLIFLLVAILRFQPTPDELGLAFETTMLDLARPDRPELVIFVLLSFLAMFGAVWLTNRLFHDLPLKSLIGPGPQGRLVAITLAVLVPVVAMSLLAGMLLTDPRPNLAPATWLGWMPLALPLLLVQVTAEELIFRGYLMQQLAVRFRSRWIWLVLPSALFGLLHFEAEKFGLNAYLVVISTGLFGLIAADVTVRCGSLVPAIVLHFGNNVLAMLILSLDGTINGLSLFVTSVHAGDTAVVRGFLLVDIAFLAAGYGVWLLVQARRSRLHSPPSRPTSTPMPEAR